MNEALSPLMEKSTNNRKKRKHAGFLIIVGSAIFVAAIIGSYFYFDGMNFTRAGEIGLFAGGISDVSPTPETAISTLVPTDYQAILSLPYESQEALAQPPQASIVTPEATSEPTPEITPEPTPHPGIRDGVFTDGEIVSDDMSYRSADLSVDIDVVEKDGHVFYVAEVYFASMDNFMPVFANGEFHNGYQTTSQMAQENDAVFAVNSDSCSVENYGIIVRYGEVYRDVLAADHMAIYGDGTLKTFPDRNISAEYLLKRGALHVFVFGPKLLNAGNPIDNFMYSHIRSPHPRTAVGMVEPFHYYFVVVDGRSEYSASITLEDLSKFMADLGCAEAYNLDGGGSSTMVLNGKLINKPEGGTEEREIDGAILFVESQPSGG